MPANKRPHFRVQFADETVIGHSIEPPVPFFRAAASAIMIRADWSPLGARHRGGCAKVGEFLATDLSTTSGTVTPIDGGLVRGKPRRTVNTWREAFWLGD
jgi:hypothetical protein